MTIRHSAGSYEIHFGGIVESLIDLGPRDFLVTDTMVAAHYGPFPLDDDRVAVVPSGESSKSIEAYSQLLSRAAQSKLRRDGRIVALGGGVVGDLAGFLAATYMRGVSFLQVPTTLLAMVDSSIGGKVGIDLPEGKNLAGAFYPPTQVRVAVEFLETLPDRHLANGAAEIWKHAFISDVGLLKLLSEAPLRPGDPRTLDIVQRSLMVKARVVQADEFETTGLRATLNFGHTIGHALEKELGYEGLLHGEAIAAGMYYECLVGESIGVTPSGTADVVREGLESQGLPTHLPMSVEPEGMVEAMKLDKKARGEGLSMSLLTEVGACSLTHGIDERTVLSVLESRR
ncbi:MAG: 3-dehydroquinate synthase [Armatimonadetes bacterium]|nr:3-dehydroquinate synthase [Armatimonadota bacterium]